MSYKYYVQLNVDDGPYITWLDRYDNPTKDLSRARIFLKAAAEAIVEENPACVMWTKAYIGKRVVQHIRKDSCTKETEMELNI